MSGAPSWYGTIEHIMAPLSDGSSGKVQYAEAIILTSKNEG